MACETQGTGSYAVKNTGDTACFVRVAVVVTQRDDNVISAVKPTYTVTPAGDWVLGSDGYYYYTQPLNVDGSTASVLTVDAPESCTVEIVASAIQTTAEAVDAWSDHVASVNNGALQVTGP